MFGLRGGIAGSFYQRRGINVITGFCRFYTPHVLWYAVQITMPTSYQVMIVALIHKRRFTLANKSIPGERAAVVVAVVQVEL